MSWSTFGSVLLTEIDMYRLAMTIILVISASVVASPSAVLNAVVNSPVDMTC